MAITPTETSLTLKNLIDQLRQEKLRINPRYQRSGKIWPTRAKSFLVETVLLDMPIPRVLLHKVDSPSPPHHSDIIDGQQRCTILAEYRDNGFALTADVDTPRFRGKFFRDLPAQDRKLFDNYTVPIDQYSRVTPKEIRQVFRRLNYYTAPLNAAEQRHAQFYGEFCRFVEEQSALWGTAFAQLRAFTKRQLIRKADQQLMTEIVDAMLKGISTPTANSLRDVYQAHERQFSSAGDFARKLDRARVRIQRWGDLRRTKLTKQYQMFSLVLATIHAESNLVALKSDLGAPHSILPDHEVLEALKPLDKAVRMKVRGGRYAPFWTASHEKTNVRENRLKRCRYFYAAITGKGTI